MATYRDQIRSAFFHMPDEDTDDTSVASTDRVILFGDGKIKSMTAPEFFDLGTWATGVNIAAAMTTGVSISGATTTAIDLTGTATTGISFSGTTTNAIKIANGNTGVAIKIGSLSSTTAGSGATLDSTVTRIVEVNADDNDTARTAGIQGRAIFGRLMSYAGTTQEDWGVDGLCKISSVLKTANVNAGVTGRFETTGTCSTDSSGGNTYFAGVMGRVGIGSTTTIGAGAEIAAVLAFNNTATTYLTHTGDYCAFLVAESAIGTIDDFDIGLKIKDNTCVTGIEIGACTTGILVEGNASTAAIKLATGTVGIGLEMAGSHTGHMIYLHPATALATGKRAIRIGDYGTEFPMVSGEGIIRTYGKVTSGTDVTAFQFHWGITESAAYIIGSQMEIESACGTPGPNGLMVHDFIGGIQPAKYIAAGGDGLVGIRSKLYADVTSVCNGDVYPLWLDHQMSCAVAGTEASIKVTTGGTKPDAFVWFNTTSSGLSQLFYFDSTMAAAEPFVATGCSVTVATVPYLKVLVNSTQYGIPLIAI